MPAEVTAEQFLQLLHDALLHVHELPFQRTHPLCDALAATPPLTPSALQQLLTDALVRLQPPPHVDPTAARWRRYRYLQLRYVDGVPIDRLGAALGIGDRQARREHHAALQELATALVQGLRESARLGDDEPRRFESVPPDAEPESGSEPADRERERSDFDTELASLEGGARAEALALGPSVEDAVGLVGRLAGRRQTEIVVGPIPARLRVVMPRTILRQVLLSILSFLLEQEQSRRIVVSVADDVGPALAQLAFAAERPDTAPAGSLSLDPPALLAARRLAESQDGALRVERPTSGDVLLRLSLVTSDATLVVLVDDNPDLVRLFRRYLRGHGFRLIPVRAGRDAVEAVRTHRPDVVTLDLMLPDQDGWDVLEALRHDSTTAAIPIIACSVLPERELALSLGATDFLAKPVNSATLLAGLMPFRRGSAPASGPAVGPARPDRPSGRR